MLAHVAVLAAIPLVARIFDPPPGAPLRALPQRSSVGEEPAQQTALATQTKVGLSLAMAGVAVGVGVVALMTGMFLLGRRGGGSRSSTLLLMPASSIQRPSGVRGYLSRRSSRRLITRGAGGRFQRRT
jgi:hypothetical protein